MKSKKRISFLFAAVSSLLLLFPIPQSGICVPPKISSPILRSGDFFPPITFSNLFTPEERAYLGVGEKAILSLGDIHAEVLVIEYMNTNCVYCISSVPTFGVIFDAIEQDRNLSKRIKIVGISAGDTRTEVEVFKKQHAVSYPIIPDTEFEAHKAVNEPTVPFIVIARRDERGKWVVATVHVGLTFSAESFVGELKAILEVNANTLKKN
jgi:hypothetical protein